MPLLCRNVLPSIHVDSVINSVTVCTNIREFSEYKSDYSDSHTGSKPFSDHLADADCSSSHLVHEQLHLFIHHSSCSDLGEPQPFNFPGTYPTQPYETGHRTNQLRIIIAPFAGLFRSLFATAALAQRSCNGAVLQVPSSAGCSPERDEPPCHPPERGIKRPQGVLHTIQDLG